MRLISRKLCRFLIIFLTGYISLSILGTSFSSAIDHLLRLCAVFDSIISSNIDEVLLISPSAVFVFGDFNVHYKDLPTLVELIDLVNFVIIFLSQMTLL